MGIMDFIKQGTREMMIARPDAAKQYIVYKHPEQTIPMFSQLTVDADEAAVFFRDGSLVGVLRTAGAGQRHTLSTGNIPFLSNLVDSFTGGNIFVTDLYFVTMRPFRNAGFGGSMRADQGSRARDHPHAAHLRRATPGRSRRPTASSSATRGWAGSRRTSRSSAGSPRAS